MAHRTGRPAAEHRPPAALAGLFALIPATTPVEALSLHWHWHELWWVRVLGVLGLLALGHLLARGRAQRLREMNRALEEEVQERRRAESALRASEARYRGLFENALDGIIIMDGERFLRCNPAAARIYGRPVEELEGHSPVEFSPPSQPDGRPSQDKAQEMVSAVMAGEMRYFEWRHLKADGSHVDVEVSLSPLNLDGTHHVLAIVRDINERRALEEQLRQSQKMEAVGRLAGGVAHDFNNILTVILGQCDMLMMSLDDRDPVRDELGQVRDAAQRAARLTGQLLAFSRRQTLHPRQISLNIVLADLEKMLRRVIGEDIQIQLELAPDLLQVNVDPGQLDQVILNLALNARDAMPGGGRLTLGTQNVALSPEQARELGTLRTGPHVRLSIRDTGHGMDSEVLGHVFEPFFTTKEAGKGTGLGLSTVYGIVTQSDGVIRVRSAPGQGTHFEILLPAAEGEPLLPRTADRQELASLGGSEHVLLVEDETAVRDVLRRTLQNHGYLVSEAENGAAALEWLAHGDMPDLVLSDVVMPEMGGLDLARSLRTSGIGLPVVLMTGYTDRELRPGDLESLQASALSKPFGPTALLKELRRRLDAPGE